MAPAHLSNSVTVAFDPVDQDRDDDNLDEFMATALSNQTLTSSLENVRLPTYDRATLTPGIVHIGVGNFHRAHQAIYLDDLFNRDIDHDWAIIGAGVRQADSEMRRRLMAQDCLSTVVELDPTGDTARVCGAMVDFAPIEPRALVAALSRPEIRIASMTITEGGYFLDADGGFDPTNPDIAHDARSHSAPRSVFGVLLAAVATRRAQGFAPLTVLSCDNIPGNGDVARATTIGLAEMMSRDLGRWIASEMAFPNSMVDRITPATGARERALVNEQFDIEDACPVVCETFRQWVMEDAFVSGRPHFEAVGVEFVENVAAYELMKLRILNGGHAAIAYPAAMMGLTYAHEAMAEPLIAGFMDKLVRTEVIPTLPEIPGVGFEDYLAVIQRRFANAKIGDTIERLCEDGSNRQPKFILPTIQDCLSKGCPVDGLALEVALWCRFCAADDANGAVGSINDVRSNVLVERARAAKSDPAAFLAMGDIFGELCAQPVFANAFATSLAALWRDGVSETLAAYSRA